MTLSMRGYFEFMREHWKLYTVQFVITFVIAYLILRSV